MPSNKNTDEECSFSQYVKSTGLITVESIALYQ